MQNNPFSDAFKTLESFGKQNNSINFNEIISASQQNIETMQRASQLIVDSMQSIAKIQSDIIQNSTQEAVSIFNDIASSKDPRESASKQADYAKSAFEKAAKDIQQIADIAQKANGKAVDLLSKQVSQNITQLSSVAGANQANNNKAANKAA